MMRVGAIDRQVADLENVSGEGVGGPTVSAGHGMRTRGSVGGSVEPFSVDRVQVERKCPLVSAASTAIPHDEAALIEQCRRGDGAAFGDLVRKYQDRVFNTCWRLCGNRTDSTFR